MYILLEVSRTVVGKTSLTSPEPEGDGVLKAGSPDSRQSMREGEFEAKMDSK